MAGGRLFSSEATRPKRSRLGAQQRDVGQAVPAHLRSGRGRQRTQTMEF